MRFARHLLLALQFFTRIPVTGRLAAWVGYSPAMLRASAAHFPAIGALVGAVAAGMGVLCLAVLPSGPYAPLVAAVLCTAATVLLTGALHEDGLADVFDALGGSLERERALEVMKDSRIGTYGALALVLAVLAKVALLALLASVDVTLFALALFAAHVTSRFWPLVLVRTMAHVGHAAGSKSKPLADRIGNASLFTAFCWSFGALAGVASTSGAMVWIAPVVASALMLLWLRAWFARRLQGFTGDCLGAAQQLCEIAFYLGLAVLLPAWTKVTP